MAGSFDYSDDDGTLQCSLVFIDSRGGTTHLLAGLGSTPADAFLAMFADEDAEELRVPAAVALALDELGHQAVRIVCQRLSGGQMESAVFAPPIPFNFNSTEDFGEGGAETLPAAFAGSVRTVSLPGTEGGSVTYRPGATPWTPSPYLDPPRRANEPDDDARDMERLRSAP